MGGGGCGAKPEGAGVAKGRNNHWRRKRRLNRRTLEFLENFGKRIFHIKLKGKKERHGDP